jgi:hypothetical protein
MKTVIFNPQKNKLKQIKEYICSSHYPNLTGSQSLQIIPQSNKKGNDMKGKKGKERVCDREMFYQNAVLKIHLTCPSLTRNNKNALCTWQVTVLYTF